MATTLKAINITKMFVPNVANFSNISRNAIQLHVTKFIQKTLISVDESGTEASAVTSSTIVDKSLPSREFR